MLTIFHVCHSVESKEAIDISICTLERLGGLFTKLDDVLCRSINQKLCGFQKNDIILWKKLTWDSQYSSTPVPLTAKSHYWTQLTLRDFHH